MFRRAVQLDHDTSKQIWTVKVKRYFFWVPITVQKFEFLTVGLALAKWKEL